MSVYRLKTPGQRHRRYGHADQDHTPDPEYGRCPADRWGEGARERGTLS